MTTPRPFARPRILVCTAEEATALDGAAIAGGTPGKALMGRAGAAAAVVITRRHAERLDRGVFILAGAGNNGGDGWVVARALHAAGARVRVWETGAPRTDDAAAARALALAAGIERDDEPRYEGEGVVVDALLGIGASGPLRGPVADGVRAIRDARARGAIVVALDVPSGLDATTGAVADDALVVEADLTLTFGTLKRGQLLARDRCGTIAVLDIGLPPADGADVPALLDDVTAMQLIPAIAADAHKGTRKRIAIVGGGAGMAGAAILAARGALRAGAGLVKLLVHEASVPAVQQAVPQALAAPWPAGDADVNTHLAGWADAIAIGPGLGATNETRALVERVLAAGDRPAVLDADALNVFAANADALRRFLGGREALLTPHPAEMMRLAGLADVAAVLERRFDLGRDFARDVGAAVLLKGVPTIVSAPAGDRAVVARGSAALATGGSGDVLTGIAATLLAQLGDAPRAGMLAAWAHGRAAELATTRAGTARGVLLDEVLESLPDALPDALPGAWSVPPARPEYPVLCELPAP